MPRFTMPQQIFGCVTARSTFGIVAPDFLAGTHIDGVGDAPVRDAVEHAVVDERCAFLVAAARTDFVGPGQAETADVGGIDLLQQAVALLLIVQTVRQPVFGVALAGVPQRVLVDLRRFCWPMAIHVVSRMPVMGRRDPEFSCLDILLVFLSYRCINAELRLRRVCRRIACGLFAPGAGGVGGCAAAGGAGAGGSGTLLARCGSRF